MKNQASILKLKKRIQGDVYHDKLNLGLYATDASLYQIEPILVVLPKHKEDVKSAMAWAKENQISILPRGGGTSLAGQTVGKSMILDFSKYMNQIIEFNEKEQWIRVQPGLVLDTLNNFLKPKGLIFAPDPATSSRANIGGMIGNNSSGTKSILYGKTVDHVLELEVLLPSGNQYTFKKQTAEKFNEIAAQENEEGLLYRNFRKLIFENNEEIEKRFPKVMRRVGGYNLDEFIHTNEWNLAKLITGSEGTLCTILEAKINLVELPKFKSACVVHFDSVMDAIKAVDPILKFQPAAVEILDHTVIDLSRKNLEALRNRDFIQGTPGAVLIVEFYDEIEKATLDRPQAMTDLLKEKNIGYAYPIFQSGKDAAYDMTWAIRKKGLGLMLGVQGDKKPVAFIEDAAIPIPVLPAYIEEVNKICEAAKTEVAVYAHASVGVLHVRPMLNMKDQVDIDRMKYIAEETFKLVQKYEGSWSGEHGDGLVRSPFNEAFFGEKIYQVLKEVKHLFDPQNLMNPGKIVAAVPMDQNLRYGTNYQTNKLETVFKYRKTKSFSNLVEMCNGVGTCRKPAGGTMCPSFRATAEEAHSTRGRANALRLAISGQLGEEGLQNEALLDALDLCLSCKACKAECPTNVDMAKLKSEVWQQKLDHQGLRLKDRFIRDSAQWAKRLSGKRSGLINRIQKHRWFRKRLEKSAGFDQRRILPDYTKTTFVDWFNASFSPKNKKNKTVIFFVDTYINYHEPEIGKAAVHLLQSCGYHIVLASVGCCQRPRISHGFLKLAKKEGTQVAEKLDVYIQQGYQVVVCEPSCASALNEDLPDLIDDAQLAERLEKNVMLLEVFLDKEKKAGNWKGALSLKNNKTVMHGHCHQKALYGTASIFNILTKESQALLEEIPSGCCGMAGAFGYEKKHYEVSEKIGNTTLIPYLNSLDNQTEVIASGFSCRHQIEHFSKRQAKHWVETVRLDNQET